MGLSENGQKKPNLGISRSDPNEIFLHLAYLNPLVKSFPKRYDTSRGLLIQPSMASASVCVDHNAAYIGRHPSATQFGSVQPPWCLLILHFTAAKLLSAVHWEIVRMHWEAKGDLHNWLQSRGDHFWGA